MLHMQKVIVVIESETKPKTLYTFATLLKDLTSVAKYIKNDEIKKLLLYKDKEKKGEHGGIGTPATRDAIIKNLFDKGFLVEEKGKIITTNLAKEFLEFLPQNAKTPDMTALWSEKQTEIKNNKLSTIEFLDHIDSFIAEEINNIKSKIIIFKEKANEKENKKKISNTNNTKSFKNNNKTSKNINHKCPVCLSGEIVEKNGKYGSFYSCNNYPTCKSIFKDAKGAK